jgi:raffinose/stachyose/melibiose transport system permease protein
MFANRKFGAPGKIALWILLLAVAVIQLFPFYWLITFSLKSNNELYKNIAGLPHVWEWNNYKIAFTTGHLGRYLWNSVIVTGLSIVVSNLLACMAAFGMIRMKWKGNQAMLAFFLIGIMIPMQATLLPLMIILKNLGVMGTHWALILPYITFAIPFSIFILSGFVAQIPREIEEAACIDGSGIYRLFVKVVMPLLKPAIATISIFTFLACWNELMFAMTFINDDALKTLTYGIMAFQGKYSVQWGPIGAGLFIATLPTLVMYLAFSEYFQKGIMAGAVKG